MIGRFVLGGRGFHVGLFSKMRILIFKTARLVDETVVWSYYMEGDSVLQRRLIYLFWTLFETNHE
jgi:hypothetical protein